MGGSRGSRSTALGKKRGLEILPKHYLLTPSLYHGMALELCYRNDGNQARGHGNSERQQARPVGKARTHEKRQASRCRRENIVDITDIADR